MRSTEVSLTHGNGGMATPPEPPESPPSIAPAPSSAAPSVRLPFAGYKHLCGPLAGATAAALAAVIHGMDPGTPLLFVALCTLGALNAYFLALLHRSLTGTLVAVAGGFLLGLLGYLANEAGSAPLKVPTPGATGLDALLAQPQLAIHPVLFVLLCPVLGAGPVALTMYFMRPRPYGMLVRMLLAAFCGGLAAVAGLVCFGFGAIFLRGLPLWAQLGMGLVGADYLLFHLQVLCLVESTTGDRAQRPALDEPDPNAPRPVTTGADDEP